MFLTYKLCWYPWNWKERYFPGGQKRLFPSWCTFPGILVHTMKNLARHSLLKILQSLNLKIDKKSLPWLKSSKIMRSRPPKGLCLLILFFSDFSSFGLDVLPSHMLRCGTLTCNNCCCFDSAIDTHTVKTCRVCSFSLPWFVTGNWRIRLINSSGGWPAEERQFSAIFGALFINCCFVLNSWICFEWS